MATKKASQQSAQGSGSADSKGDDKKKGDDTPADETPAAPALDSKCPNCGYDQVANRALEDAQAPQRAGIVPV